MSVIPEKDFGQYEISLKYANGELIPAHLHCGCRDWTTNGQRNTECRITLKWDNQEVEDIAGDFFSCFEQIRKQLTPQGIYPVCYGASRRTIVTGMAIEMGLGRRVYKNTELGMFPNRSQLVPIFASGEDVEPVSVEVQRKFKSEWAKSIRKFFI